MRNAFAGDNEVGDEGFMPRLAFAPAGVPTLSFGPLPSTAQEVCDRQGANRFAGNLPKNVAVETTN